MKAIKSIQIILFFVMLLAPIVFFNFNPEKVLSVENKVVSKMPALYTETGEPNVDFRSQFEMFWDDNIGFKEPAIILHTSTMYSLFHKLNVPYYFEGKENHLYASFDSSGGIEDYQNIEPLPIDTLERTCENMEKGTQYFNDKGANFLIFTIPDKEGIYPEYYPDFILQHSDQSTLDQIVTFTKNHSDDVDITNLKHTLLDGKSANHLLYYKSYDCVHWNDLGAFVAYQEIMQQCKKYIPDLQIYKPDDVRITVKDSPTTLKFLSQSSILQKTLYFEDVMYEVDPMDNYNATLMEDMPLGISEADLGGAVLKYFQNHEVASPKVLILGDSYIEFNLELMAESFSELVFTTQRQPATIAKLMDYYQPDLVIHQVVERTYGTEFAYLAWLADGYA